MIRGIIKPNGQYKSHIHAGIVFPASGREFSVQDDQKLFAAAKAELEAAEKAELEADRDNEIMVDSIKRKYREKLATLKIGIIDRGEDPLVMSSKAYDQTRAQFGKGLTCEPVNGMPAGHELVEREADAGKKSASRARP